MKSAVGSRHKEPFLRKALPCHHVMHPAIVSVDSKRASNDEKLSPIYCLEIRHKHFTDHSFNAYTNSCEVTFLSLALWVNSVAATCRIYAIFATSHARWVSSLINFSMTLTWQFTGLFTWNYMKTACLQLSLTCSVYQHGTYTIYTTSKFCVYLLLNDSILGLGNFSMNEHPWMVVWTSFRHRLNK